MILNSHRNASDLYRLAATSLGLKPGAGQDEVRKAYRRAAQKFHPDQHVGEGKDALYSARFHLATAAKTLLLSKGSEGERKALDDFNKAKASYDEAMKKAGVSPTSMGAEETPPRAARGANASAGSQHTRADHAYTYGRTRTASGPQGETEGKTADGQSWKRWTPPPFEEPSAWNGSRQETRASQSAQGAAEPQPQPKRQEGRDQEDPRPFKEATRESTSSTGFWSAGDPPPMSEVFKRTFETSASEAGVSARPASSSRPTVETVAPTATPRPSVETAAPTAPPSNYRSAARAYEQAQAAPSPKSRFDAWA